MRPRMLGIHRWLGLALGPFLLLQVITGAFLVASELPSANAPRPAMGEVAAMLDRTEAALPGYRVSRLYLPDRGHCAFAELGDAAGNPTYAEVDSSGSAIRSGPLWRFPYRAAVQLHYRLLMGKTGMAIVLATGCALALAVTFGFLFWWPGLGRVRQALRPRARLPARQRLRHWHRSLGAMIAIPALFSALTGVTLMVPDLTASSAAAPQGAFTLADPARVETALRAAQAQFPDAALRDVRFPRADRIDINFHAREYNPRAVHVVSVRLSDGAVLKTMPARDNPALWIAVLPLHTGQSFGLAGALVLLMEAAALVFLVWAGTRMWLGKRRKS